MRHAPGGLWDVCTADSDDGLAVFAPDATLRNVGESAIPWYPRLSGRNPPYDNDQHPFLIWNLYRLDEDGVLRQIARSGVKHAFFAVNAECACRSEHIVFPSCVDTYSAYNNDSIDVLGPRSEVLPALGIWGRCGSVVDPSCGAPPPSNRVRGSDDSLRYRLAVSELALDATAHPNSQFFFEYGYLIRDSDKPDGAFGYREVKPAKTPTAARAAAWSMNPGPLTQGLVVDAWVGSSTPNEAVAATDIVTTDGTVRIGVKAAQLKNGRYRFRYAFANIDFAVADISGEGDKIRVTNPHGISAISIPVSSRAKLSNSGTTAEDLLTAKPWSLSRSPKALRWKSPRGNELTWGELMTIYFDSDRPPESGRIEIIVETSSGERTFSSQVP